MLRYDRVLIAPTRDELEKALTDAAKAANKGCRSRKIEWKPADTQTLLAAQRMSPEGYRQWCVEKDFAGPAYQEMGSIVAASWWTDPLGQVHVRIGSDRAYLAHDVRNIFATRQHQHQFYISDNIFLSHRASTDFAIRQERPFCWQTYPEDIYFQKVRENVRTVACCPCGAAGSLKSLGWMGLHCAACHDRLQERLNGSESGNWPRTMFARETSSNFLFRSNVFFTPNGKWIVAGPGNRGKVRIWDFHANHSDEAVAGSEPAAAAALSPDGNTLALLNHRSNAIWLYSIAAGAIERILPFTDTAPSMTWTRAAVAFSRDGAFLAFCADRRVELWNLRTTSRAAVVGGREWPECAGLAFSPDSNLLIVGNCEGVYAWNIAAQVGHFLRYEGCERHLSHFAMAPNGQTFGIVQGDIVFADRANGKTLGTAFFGDANAYEIAFSPDGRIVAASAYRDSLLRFFSVPDGRPLGEFYWHMDRFAGMAFSPDGRYLATSSADGHVKLWPVQALLAASD